MKVFKFLLSLAITVGLAWFLNHPIPLKTLDLPPLGKLINPFTGFWKNAEPATEMQSETLRFPELKAPVKVFFDERLVPHLFAQNLEDALFVQGYITARFRLWQMDFGPRLSGGKLSEAIGERTLETDKKNRRMGLLKAAEKTVEVWKKSGTEIALLDAYTHGVNAFIETLKPKDYPIEFKLLDYEPEPWTYVHTALIIKNMELTLSSIEDDIESTNALDYFGQETFDFLFPEYNPKQKPVIPAGTFFDFDTVKITHNPRWEGREDLKEIGLLSHKVWKKPDPVSGSNNWAVSGSKTASGNPILCNDPHLRLTLPSVWFEIQIHTPDVNVYGVSLPGIPGVIIGFNENIAWGQTNVGHDVLDWYRIQWADEKKKSYWLDGEQKEVKEVVETIKIKGKKEPVRDTVKYTIWGPVIYQSEDHPRHDLAMRWLAVDEPSENELAVFTGLNRSRNYEDFSNALSGYESPAQNYVFASKEGSIAIKVNGKFPLKRNQQGRFVEDGSHSDNGWQGWIPMSQIPQIKNPSQGYVASANQHSTDPTYPYYYNSATFDDYRARHLVESLSRMDSLTTKDMMAWQNDNFSLLAKEGLELLLKNTDTTRFDFIQTQILKKLQNWDYRFEEDAIAPVLFTEWWREFYEMTWDEILVFRDSVEMLYPENWRTVDLIENNPDHPFFDIKNTPEKETVNEIATGSFLKMCENLNDNVSDLTYNWAQHKGTVISHLGHIPAFSSNTISVGGYKQALNAISTFFGPSWRMIVELGEEVSAFGVYPGGQSGNPGSRYYDQMIDTWSKGEYYELFFMKDEKDSRQKILFSQAFEK